MIISQLEVGGPLVDGKAPGAVRVADVRRGAPLVIRVGGRAVEAFAGETVATALIAAGIAAFRVSATRGEKRGPVCLMGICQECVVEIDGVAQPACQVFARDGMVVTLDDGS